MQKIILLSIVTFFSVSLAYGQSEDTKAIKATIAAFAKAGDQNKVDVLAEYLDDNYRVVMNRLFGSKEVSTMSKAIYLEKIRTKEFGGDQRSLTIKKLVINGSTASAQVTFKGQKLTFVSVITLVKDGTGKWKLVSDMPIVK